MVNAIIFVFCKVTAFTWKFYFLVYFFRTFCDFILAGKSQWPLALTVFGESLGVENEQMEKFRQIYEKYTEYSTTIDSRLYGLGDDSEFYPTKHWTTRQNCKKFSTQTFPLKQQKQLPVLSDRTSLIRYRLIDSVSKLYYT